MRPLVKLLVAKWYNTRKNREKSTKTGAVKHVPVLAAMLAEWNSAVGRDEGTLARPG